MSKYLNLFVFVLVTLFVASNCSFAPTVVGIEDELDLVDRAVTYTEDFEKCSASGTSYQTGSFIGNNGLTWNYVQTAWAGGVIAGSKTPVLGMNRSPLSELYTTVSSGVGTLSFSFKKPYSTAVSLNVYAGSTLLGTVTTTGTTVVSKSFTVNQAGSVKIRFVQSGTTSGQVSIDNVSWTGYTASSSPPAGGATLAEDFEKCSASGTSYQTGSFIGNNGLTWNYVQTAWAGGVIAGSKTPVLGTKRSPLSELYTTVSSGVGTLSFSFKKPYSTAVSLNVYAGSTLLGTVTTTGTAVVSKSFTVNQAGSVKIRFVQSGTTSGQVSIDNVSWTSYGSSSGGNDKIKIASFNIEIFGPTKAGRPNVLYTLAHIATRYDIIAIQEVGSNGNPSESTAIAVMDAYLAKINSIAGSGAYSYVRGHQYAFVYKNSTITKKASQLYAGSKSFTYSPLIGNFVVKNGNFDFSLITIHTSPSKAKTEIPALTTAMSEVRTLYNEQDVICLGDFNADGSYYSAGAVGGDLAGFPATTYITVIKNGTDTTVSPNNDFTYDRMQLYKAATSEDFTGNKGVLKFAGNYDLSKLEGTANTAGTENALSDHYPIWAEFYTGRDSD